MNEQLRQKFARVELLVMDVDGVMTDGSVVYAQDGSVSLRFSIVDGLGLVILQRAGIQAAILTSSQSEVIAARAKRLGIKHLFMGALSKGLAFPSVCEAAGLGPDRVAYVSDDVNDYAALKQAGLRIAVANAQPQILAAADYVTTLKGGEGAIREVCNLILAAKGLDPVALWEQPEGAKSAG